MIVNVIVKPSSKKGPLVQPALDGSLMIYVREPALEGKANQAVQKVLAEYYGVAKNRVQLVGGQTSKQKRFVVVDK